MGEIKKKLEKNGKPKNEQEKTKKTRKYKNKQENLGKTKKMQENSKIHPDK